MQDNLGITRVDITPHSQSVNASIINVASIKDFAITAKVAIAFSIIHNTHPVRKNWCLSPLRKCYRNVNRELPIESSTQ